MSVPSSDAEIVSLHFQGFVRDDIVKAVKHGGGTVNRKIVGFTKLSEKIGLDQAAEKYGVRELLKNLYSLSVDLKRKDISVDKAKSGSSIAADLKQLGVEKDLPSFVRKVQRQESKYPLPDIIKFAEQLCDLEKETGKNYQQIIAEFREKSKEVVVLDQQIDDKRKTKKELDAEIESMLQEKDTTSSQLKEFVEARDQLNASGLGITVDKLPVLSRILKNVEEVGFDTKKVIKILSDVSSLSQRIEESNSEIKTKTEELEKLNSEISRNREDWNLEKSQIQDNINKLKEEHKSLKNELVAFRKILAKGVSPEAIMRMNELLEAANIEPQILENELKTLGNLKNLIQNESVKLSQIQDKETVIERRVKKLTLREQELDDGISSLLTKLKQAEIDLKEITKAALEAGKEIGRIEPTTKLYEILGSGGKPEDVIPMIHTFLFKIEAYLKRYGADPNTDTAFWTLRERLRTIWPVS